MSGIGQPQWVARIGPQFLIFTAAEVALVLLYKLAFSLNAFGQVEHLPSWVKAITPYLANAGSPIPANVALLIALYYALSTLLILMFVLFCFRARTKIPSLKWTLVLVFGLPIFLWGWMVGANLRTFKMAEFHLGNIWAHLVISMSISVITTVLCARAFFDLKIREGDLHA